MAEYTIELRHVVEGRNIFDFNYPFYDEKKRAEFERNFIRHFYFREIGAETIDRFMIYLEDKMNVIFPYYNKLFEAATVEYDLLNNYNLTEEFETTRKNKGKTHGISSTVGQLFGDSNSENKQARTVTGTGEIDSTGKDTETETTETDTATTNKQTVDTTNDKTTSENVTKKFLDTPQGLTDLTNSKYLTTLNQDTASGTEKDVGKQTTDGEGTVDTDVDRTLTRNRTDNQTSESKEITDDTLTGTTHDEQKTTQDNDSRTYLDSEQKEVHKLTRIGNIGVQTGADMIRIHVELQKTLRKIERMFFDECEDLFMLVY